MKPERFTSSDLAVHGEGPNHYRERSSFPHDKYIQLLC